MRFFHALPPHIHPLLPLDIGREKRRPVQPGGFVLMGDAARCAGSARC